MAYDRYKNFREGDTIKIVPFIQIQKRSTDRYVIYNRSESRLDLISYEFYGDPSYGWLILQANPEVGSLEFLIPNNTRLRIPYPLNEVLIGYDNTVDEYYRFYAKEE